MTTTFAPEMTVVGNLTRPHTSGIDTLRRVVATWDVPSPSDPNCQRHPLTFVARVDLTSPFGAGGGFTAQNHYVSVLQGNPPRNPQLPCRLMQQCDAPIYTAFCVTGGLFIINASPEYCIFAIEAETWSKVKALYR